MKNVSSFWVWSCSGSRLISIADHSHIYIHRTERLLSTYINIAVSAYKCKSSASHSCGRMGSVNCQRKNDQFKCEHFEQKSLLYIFYPSCKMHCITKSKSKQKEYFSFVACAVTQFASIYARCLIFTPTSVP